MTRYTDYTGQRFGLLVVKEIYSRKPIRWLCVCECGGTTIVLASNLAQGRAYSCGCRKKRTPKLPKGQLFGTPARVVENEKEEEGQEDVVLEQGIDIKVLKQLVAGAKDNSTINIIYNPVTIINKDDGKNGNGLMRALFAIINEVPEPKIPNLVDLAYKSVIDAHKGNISSASEYLKVNKKTLYNHREART